MKMRRSLPYAVLAALLVVLVPLGGVAVAQAKTIGKNLVVTKSIKNGAVTAAKLAPGAVDGNTVKNGSLTAADLAPGTIPTIPAPTNGKSAAFGSMILTSFGPGVQQVFSPFGPGSTTTTFGAIAPTQLSVADFHALSNAQTGGLSLQVALVSAPDFTTLPNGTNTVATCTISGGATTCSSTGTGTIPAGNLFWLVSTNGPSGSAPNFVAASYTTKVQ